MYDHSTMKSNRFYLFSSLSVAVFIAALAMQFIFSFNAFAGTNLINKTSDSFFSQSHSHPSTPISENNILVSIDELEEDETFNEKGSLPVLIFSVLISAYHIREADNNYISQSLVISVPSIPLHIKNCIYLI